MVSIGYMMMSMIFWLFVVMIILYYHAFRNAYNDHSSIHTTDKFGLSHRKPAYDAFISSNLISYDSTSSSLSSSSASSSSSLSSSSSSPSSSSSSSSYKIFFDWPLDSDDLSYLNYKSLESFLARCYEPHHRIEINILGNQVANGYKVVNLLSKTTFLKYERKGYHIKTIVHSSTASLFHSYDIQSSLPVIGERYFDTAYHHTCSSQQTKISNASMISPISFWFYARIARLYAEGGEYYDLSWFHQQPITTPSSSPSSSIMHGCYIISYCWDINNATILTRPTRRSLHISDDHSIMLGNSNNYKCASSTIMIFPQQHIVLKCMLLEYEDASSRLRQCLHAPTILPYHNAALQPYEEAMCIKYAFDRCFEQHDIKNDLAKSNLISSINAGERHYLGTNVSLLSHADAEWSIISSPMLWLGIHATAGQWHYPYQLSYLHDEINQNNHIISSYASSSPPSSLSSSPSSSLSSSSSHNISCSRYQTEDYYDIKHHHQAEKSCTLSFVIPGFMKAGTTYLFDLITKHPQILLTLKGVGFKETGCYYREATANHRSHHRMNCFPFVESHEGLTYGDGTVYYIMRYPVADYLKRENPNIKTIVIIRDPITRAESHHRFSYRQYNEQGLGNMNTVVDEALAPGSRLDEIYQLALPVVDAFKQGDMYKDNLLHKFINVAKRFFSPGARANASYQRAANTLFFSLYFHPIYIWDQVMGMENIYVIEAERIAASRTHMKLHINNQLHMGIIEPITLEYSGFIMKKTLEEELRSIFRFIGVTPLANVPRSNQHKSLDLVPEHHLLNDKSRKRLEVFYKPFNELLAIYLKRFRNNVHGR